MSGKIYKRIRAYCKLRNIPYNAARKAYKNANNQTRALFHQEMNDHLQAAKNQKKAGSYSQEK